MQNPLTIATKTLLEPAELTAADLTKYLHLALKPAKVDDADIYLQYQQSESWVLEDSIIKSGSFSIDHGFSVRALSGDKTGFAYADDINAALLRETACAARNIAECGAESAHKVIGKKIAGKKKILQKAVVEKKSSERRGVGNNASVYRDHYRTSFGLGLYPFLNPLDSISENAKVELLRCVDETARHEDSRVVQVIASLLGAYEVVLILSSDGGLAADVRPLVRLNVTVIVEEQQRREKGYHGGGTRNDYSFFLDHGYAAAYAREAVRIALLNLRAQAAPVGTMPVVLGHGWPAVLLHEAVGHGLEGDFIRKKSSVYTGRIGEKVASSACTLVDQGNLAGNRRGSLHVDDEGTPTQCTLLIENGVLRSYMQDKLNARLLGVSPTGNGRRESYSCAPLPRMTNTYLLGGDCDPAEIIASVDNGLYAVNFSGGQVDITSGEFVFTTNEAYLIENGKVTAPVKQATLIGNGPDVMHKIVMVGSDAAMDEGSGSCGKDGQTVPVGVGQPTLKVSELVVGGSG